MPRDYTTKAPDDALDFLAERINIPINRSGEVAGEEINAAFVVAGAMGSILQDLRRATDDAITAGTSYADFQTQFAQIANRYGWSYTGSEAWRSQLILSQNLRTAYAAGRYRHQFDPEVLRVLPFLQYVHSDAAVPRPNHLALDGKVFDATDPRLSVIYPPNGFGCGCRMNSLSRRDAERLGLNIEPIGDDFEIDGVDISPDTGFDFAPGSSDSDRRRQLIFNMLLRFDDDIADSIRGLLDLILQNENQPESDIESDA